MFKKNALPIEFLSLKQLSPLNFLAQAAFAHCPKIPGYATVTEIEFLTHYARNGNYLVIYVGAAPGIHINYLSELFPNVSFVLIDKRKSMFRNHQEFKVVQEH